MSREQHALDDIDRRFGEPSRNRLRSLVEFAQLYRGWTGREAAAFLRRDVHNVVPGSGVPKVDLLLRLARALDWPASVVLDEVCGDAAAAKGPAAAGAGGFDDLNQLAYAAFADGRFEELIALARSMSVAANSPEERATACLREYGGWDGLGRYEQAVASLQRGLAEVEVNEELKLRLRANLSSALLALGRWTEGEGVATVVIERLEAIENRQANSQGVLATALYVRGACRRNEAAGDRTARVRLALAASADLRRAAKVWREYHTATSVDNYAAAAMICDGLLIGAEVLSGELRLDEAIVELLAGLDAVVDPRTIPAGWWREAFGWWCVVGAELILANRAESPDRERELAIFTNKGHELAELSGHWLLRERVVTLEYLRRSGGRGQFVDPSMDTLDREDVQVLAGVMARFPAFRPLGWELVRTARRID